MAITRVQSNAQVPNVNYEGTLEIPEIDQSAVVDAIDTYGEIKKDEITRLEENLDNITELTDDILGETFVNELQLKEYNDLRKEVGLTDEYLSSIDLSNPYARIEMQRKAAKLHQSPRYSKIQRDKTLFTAMVDEATNNPESYGELRPVLFEDLNRFAELRPGDEPIDISDLSPTNYYEVDEEKRFSGIAKDMEDQILLELRSSGTPDRYKYLVEVTEKSVEDLSRSFENELLNDKSNIRRTYISRGYIEEQPDGTFTITNKGKDYVNNQADKFKKRMEKFSRQLTDGESGGTDPYLKLKGAGTRFGYYDSNSSVNKTAQALDRDISAVARLHLTSDEVNDILNKDSVAKVILDAATKRLSSSKFIPKFFSSRDGVKLLNPEVLASVIEEDTNNLGFDNTQLDAMRSKGFESKNGDVYIKGTNTKVDLTGIFTNPSKADNYFQYAGKNSQANLNTPVTSGTYPSSNKGGTKKPTGPTVGGSAWDDIDQSAGQQ